MQTEIWKDEVLIKSKYIAKGFIRNFSVEAWREFATFGDGKKWKTGDVVKFDDGFIQTGTWKDWFYTTDQKELYFRKHPKVPKYARDQYAIIMSRYKVTKDKMFDQIETYCDYGTILMFLTGAKPGHLKRVYMTNPFKKIASFPYDSDIPSSIKNILGFINLETLKKMNENTSRSLNLRRNYLSILKKKLNRSQ